MPSFSLLDAGHGKARCVTLRVAYALSTAHKRALREQRVSAALAPFRSTKSLLLAFSLRCEQPRR